MTEQENIQVMIALIPHVHVFYCLKGGHYGVGVGLFDECPSGCHSVQGYWFCSQ